MSVYLEVLGGKTIAVQKGRLTDDSILWLNENTGSRFLRPINAPAEFDRTGEMYDKNTDITIVGFSNGGVLQAVEKGYAEYGIAGSDKWYEKIAESEEDEAEDQANDRQAPQLQKIEDLGFSACRMVVARPKDQTEGKMSRVLTTYPALTRSFFKRVLWFGRNPTPKEDIDIDVFPGSIETIGRREGYSAIVDLTQTGQSLAANNWQEVATVMACQAILFRAGTRQDRNIPFDDDAGNSIKLSTSNGQAYRSVPYKSIPIGYTGGNH